MVGRGIMSSENWKIVKELLNELLEAKPEDREAILRSKQVSADILKEVKDLLAFETEAEGLMQLSAAEFSKDFIDHPDADPNGSVVGNFRLIREIGHGGMGAVHLAERNDGKFEQKAALKLLRREMNTAAVRRHFEQEAEILAAMEHQNIARLLDAGTTADGIPYIAMEYVDGIPIDKYCESRSLGINERLMLFRTVCSAVSHAHKNLIVHRDLKPSNILITDDGTPKLLDFGISKILTDNDKFADAATITRLGVMTPSYASPEQLQKRTVTTATDIYSLGVLLYELLSGSRPFQEAEDDLGEIYRSVIEKDVLPPSAKLIAAKKQFTKAQDESAPTPASPQTAQMNTRRTASLFNKIDPGVLKGDLDNIVLKALRKEPDRRYISADSFAEDLKRYVDGMPVTARPHTFSYRAEKFLKRNRGSVAAAGLIFVALFAGLAMTLWQTFAAMNERAKAERRFNDVRKLANSYLFDVYPLIENLEGSLKAREAIVSNALQYLDGLSQEAGGDDELSAELATAYEKIGDVQGAINTQTGADINAGLASYRKAQTLRRGIAGNAPNNIANKVALAKNIQIVGKTLWWNNDAKGAEEAFLEAETLFREALASDPASAERRNDLAILLLDHGAIPTFNREIERAEKFINEAVAIIKQLHEENSAAGTYVTSYTRSLRASAQLKKNRSDFDGAIASLRESIALTDDLIAKRPDDYRLARSGFLNNLILCETYINLPEEGAKLDSTPCLAAVKFNTGALEKEPGDTAAMNDLAVSYFNVARVYRKNKDFRKSIEYSEKAIEQMNGLIAENPNLGDYARSIGIYHSEIGDSLRQMGDFATALKHLSLAKTNIESAIEKDADVEIYRYDLSKVFRLEASCYGNLGQPQKAIEKIDLAIKLISELKEKGALKASDQTLIEELEKEKAAFKKKS